MCLQDANIKFQETAAGLGATSLGLGKPMLRCMGVAGFIVCLFRPEITAALLHNLKTQIEH